MNEFEAIRNYDVPEVLLKQMLDGELSLHSTWETLGEGFGGDPRIPLQERDTIASDMIAKYGGNAFADTAIGVLTNPLTYLMFITSPAGAKASKGLFDVAPKLSAWAMDNIPLLHHLKAVTGNHYFRGTGVLPAMEQYQRSVSRWDQEMKGYLREPWKDFSSLHGVRGAWDSDKQPKAIRDFSTLLHLKMSRAFEHTVEYLPEITHRSSRNPEKPIKSLESLKKAQERGEDVLTEVTMKQVDHKAMVNMSEAEIDKMIADLGGSELADAIITQRDAALKKLFYDEAGNVDPNKLKRMYNSSRLSTKDAMKGATASGDQVLQQLFGPDTTRMLREGVINEESFNNIVTNMFGKQFGQNAASYMPRNYYQFYRGGSAEKLSRNNGTFSAITEHKRGILGTSANTRGRNRKTLLYDPDALNEVERLVGPDRMSREFVEDNRKRFMDEVSKAKINDTVATLDVDSLQSMARYDNQARRTNALFVEQVDDRTQEAWDNLIDYTRKTDPKVTQELTDRGIMFRNDTQGFAKLGEGGIPEGGYTISDMIDVSDGLLGNSEKRKVLREVFLPRLTGEATSTTMMAGLVSSSARTVAQSLARTDLGKALSKEKGPVGNIFRKIEEFADSSANLGSKFDQDIASYFYTSHLGLNMGSVVANLSQPIITTARWVGFRDLLPAYKETTEQYLKFVGDLSKTPKKYLTDPEFRVNLIQKHFPLAGESSLLKDSLDELMDFDLKRTGVLSGMTPGSAFQNMKDATLFPFQQAEIFNRVVTANAVARRNVRIGRTQGGKLTNQALDEVNRAVQETQFGTDLLNTPIFLLNGGLSNPLLKQFLQFPLRMAIAPFEIGATLAGNENTLRGIGVDLLRGVGISAIGYEVLKGTLGQDASDLGFIESSLQLGTGAVDDEDGPLPIPPILDIPIDLARGITTGDQELMARSFIRSIPGGVALQRVLNSAPALSTPTFLNYQRRYADWKNPNEAGQVPVYDSSNRLISFENPETLLAQAVGLDRSGFKDEAELTRFLMNQSEAERSARQQLINAIYNNNVTKAQQIRNDFQKRFGYKLTVSNAQMKGANRLREQTRAERILDRTPQDIRSQMARLVAQTDPNLGVPQDQFVASQTAKDRDPHRMFSANNNLDSATREYISRLLEGAANGPTDRTVSP